jgi:ABC-type protease/lipase transport system fused ATPase/permease subunit
MKHWLRALKYFQPDAARVVAVFARAHTRAKRIVRLAATTLVALSPGQAGRGFDLSREQVALVLQESIILPATVAENIAFARPSASPHDIEVAARAANAHGFIDALPDKYKTLIGEGASPLSIGADW